MRLLMANRKYDVGRVRLQTTYHLTKGFIHPTTMMEEIIYFSWKHKLVQVFFLLLCFIPPSPLYIRCVVDEGN